MFWLENYNTIRQKPKDWLMSLLCSWSLFNVYVIISCTWIFNRGKFCVFLRMVFMCMFAQVEMVKIYMRLKNTSNLCLWIVLIFVSDILRSIQYVNIRRANIFLEYENWYHIQFKEISNSIYRFQIQNHILGDKLKLFQNVRYHDIFNFICKNFFGYKS